MNDPYHTVFLASENLQEIQPTHSYTSPNKKLLI